jgi:thiol:disulfide interchange protein
MGLTALALLWLCWRLGGSMFAAAASLFGITLLLWLGALGKRQAKGLPGRPMALGLLGTLALSAAVLPQVFQPRTPGAVESILNAQPFSEDALAKARASGKPVFVYFTADWCLTCKVNEGAAIEREETKAAFEKAGVQVLVGDWTRRDPAITRFLTAQGAAGVPLYLWYVPGKDAEQLPQVLSVAELAGRAAR